MSDKKATFYLLRIVYAISILGSGITSYALGLWVYELTENTSDLVWLTFCGMAPRIYLGIFAGYYVDIFNRKIIIIVANAVASLIVLALFSYVSIFDFNFLALACLAFLLGCCSSILSITFMTTVSMFIKREEYLKINGLVSAIDRFPIILGPFCAVIVLESIGIHAVLLIDLLSYIFLISIIYFIPFPQIETRRKKFSFSRVFDGLKIILSKRKLKTALLIFSIENIYSGITLGLILPLFLIKSGQDNFVVAYNSIIASAGVILGGFAIARFKFLSKINPFRGILLIFILIGITSRLSIPFINYIYIIGFVMLFRNILTTAANAFNDTIWQKEVVIQDQGKVFGTRRFFAQGFIPLTMLMTVSFVDYILPKSSNFMVSLSNTMKRPIEEVQLDLLFFSCGILEVITPIIIVLFIMKGQKKHSNFSLFKEHV